MKIAIIGGGASGMMAALTASEKTENHVTLFERQARMGKKLLATGNGRCNLSNRDLSLEHYHGNQPEFCAYALEQFGTQETLDFFRALGLLTVTEESGRVYPYSDSANSVADVLRLHLEQRKNVELVTACEITSLRRKNKRFTLEGEDECYIFDCVILCAGGVAGGKLGGTDLGYKLLSSFGHKRTKLYPALVQLRTDTAFVRSLKGVRCEALVEFRGKKRRGELQFTDYGVSGPVIFELSREISTQGGQGELCIDLLPHMSKEELLLLLKDRRAAMPQLRGEDFLTGILHNRLGRTLLRACGCSLERLCGDYSGEELEQIAKKIKHFCLTLTGVMGMDQAQVTAGGIDTAEFCDKTMESRLCPGLYAAGEVLDIDGDCGGYNLQWAWASGRLAGKLRGSL